MMDFIHIYTVSCPCHLNFCYVILLTTMLPSTVLSVLWLFFFSQFSCLTSVNNCAYLPSSRVILLVTFYLYTVWKPGNFKRQFPHITPLSKLNCTDQRLILKWQRPVTDIVPSLKSSVLIGERWFMCNERRLNIFPILKST